MDGVRAINGEECDDGNSNNNDGWTNTGTISPDYRYTIFSINKMQNFTLHKIEFTYFFNMLLFIKIYIFYNSWNDNMLGRSVCRLKWGNGIRDQTSEECDDDNNDDGDGCSSNWKVENTYYWSGGTVTSKDTWGNLVYIYFESIDSDNTVLITKIFFVILPL